MKNQNRRLYIAMAAAFVLIMVHQWVLIWLDKSHPEWNLLGRKPAATQAVADAGGATTGPTTAAVAGGGGGATITTAPVASVMAATTQFAAAENARGATLGSAKAKDPEYAMQLVLTARGAGIESVTLNDHKRAINTEDRFVYQEPWAENPDGTRAMATQWISVDGLRTDLISTNWTLENATADAATYVLDGPKVAVRKTYRLTKRKAEAGQADTRGFEVRVDYAFVNKTGAPVTVKTGFNGTITPPRELDSGPDRNVTAGYWRADREKVVIHQHYIEDYTKEKPEGDLTKADDYPLMWMGLTSVYFDALVRPDPLNAAGQVAPPSYIAKAGVRAMNPDAQPWKRVVVSAFETGDLVVAPGATATMPMRLYLGPKSRGVIDNAYYSGLPFTYNKTLVVSSGPCGFCVFDWVINALVALLRVLHVGLRDWGLAIIGLVCIVRGVLHPITKRSQVNMMKMGKMGPEMERIKQKYKDDPEAQNRAVMQFYKEQGAAPILGCLPMFLQMPIFIGLYSCLQTTFELRHSPFLFGWTWINDLSQPDRLIWFKDHPVNLWFFHVDALNLLPILCAIVSYINMKVTPKPAATTPEQEQQQKMMQWMTLVFPLFFYNMASGLNLYYLTTMGLGIIEGKIIRKHIKEREEAEKAGKVFVEPPAKVKRHGGDGEGGGSGVRRKAPGGKPQGGLAGFMANLREKAAELQREAERKRK